MMNCGHRPLVAIAAALPAPAFAYKVFISNEGDNTMTVLDGEKMEVIATVPSVSGRAASP